jgi:hypothetical protein
MFFQIASLGIVVAHEGVKVDLDSLLVAYPSKATLPCNAWK